MMNQEERKSFLVGQYSPRLSKLAARSSQDGSLGSAHAGSPTGSGKHFDMSSKKKMKARHMSLRPRADRLRAMTVHEREEERQREKRVE